MFKRKIIISTYLLIFYLLSLPLANCKINPNEEISIANAEVFTLYGPERHTINSTEVLDTSYLIEWEFSCNDSLAEIDIIALNETYYENFTLGYDYLSYELIEDASDGYGCFEIPFSGIWHVVFVRDVDFASIYVEVTATVNFIPIPEQNDANTGLDAPNSYSLDLMLTTENYQGSGKLIYLDQTDFFAFFCPENHRLILGFYFEGSSLVDFTVYRPGCVWYDANFSIEGFESVDFFIDIIFDMEGNWTFSVAKSDMNDFSEVNYSYSVRFFPLNDTTTNGALPNNLIITVELSFVVLIIAVFRKRSKLKN